MGVTAPSQFVSSFAMCSACVCAQLATRPSLSSRITTASSLVTCPLQLASPSIRDDAGVWVGVGVAADVSVGDAVSVGVGVGECVGVGDGTGDGEGVGPGPRFAGNENADVFPLESVAVAVTCGPAMAPLNAQLPLPSAVVAPS